MQFPLKGKKDGMQYTSHTETLIVYKLLQISLFKTNIWRQITFQFLIQRLIINAAIDRENKCFVLALSAMLSKSNIWKHIKIS